MGGVGVAICTPPLGMWLATLMSPKKYSPEERQAGKAALAMGMIGISEGAIPLLLRTQYGSYPPLFLAVLPATLLVLCPESSIMRPGVAGSFFLL